MLDARSLAMHRLAADALRQNPERFTRVRDAIARWLTQGHVNARPYLLEWHAIVESGLAATLEAAVAESEHATALRQSSPVTIVLTNAERFAFLKEWSRGSEAIRT